MAIQNEDFFGAAQAALPDHPVVLRFASMHPAALARYEMHLERRGGDTSHVDPDKTPLNKRLIGDADWLRKVQADIDLARVENLAAELDALKRRKRMKERQLRLLEGATDPWRQSEEGPLREVILTAHRDWFAVHGEMEKLLGFTREAEFERHAIEWLRSRFGGAVVHARADHDEMTYHIHAVIVPWVEKTSERRGRQRLIQPSSIPVLRDYEKAQDDVGEFFGRIGLQRGKRTAAARREALAARAERQAERERLEAGGQPVPEELAEAVDPPAPAKRKHVPTPVWWAEETRRLAQNEEKAKADALRLAQRDEELRDRAARVDAREREAEAVIGFVESYAAGTARPEMQPSGNLGTRLMAAFRRVGQNMRMKAEADARKSVAVEAAAVSDLRASVLALRDRMVNVLKVQLRARFARETDAELKAVKAAEDRLEALRRRDSDRQK